MKDAIIKKLHETLSGPIDTECKAVYLLCEVRKVLNREHPGAIPFPLGLYCHWALHVDLCGESTTLPFLQRLDTYVWNKLYGSESGATIVEEDHLFREFIYLDTFRRELREFLAGHELPTAPCDEDARWDTFIAAYTGVIEDGSLSCWSPKSEDLKIVDQVTFTKSAARAPNSHLPFEVKWDILRKDGKRLKVEVGTQAERDLLHWGIKLG